MPQQPQQQVGQDPNQPQAAGQQGGQTGAYQKEMKMDEKWIPAMPVPGWKSWTSRGKELSGFKDWLEKFSGWFVDLHRYCVITFALRYNFCQHGVKDKTSYVDIQEGQCQCDEFFLITRRVRLSLSESNITMSLSLSSFFCRLPIDR